jgi:hypothetical protein
MEKIEVQLARVNGIFWLIQDGKEICLTNDKTAKVTMCREVKKALNEGRIVIVEKSKSEQRRVAVMEAAKEQEEIDKLSDAEKLKLAKETKTALGADYDEAKKAAIADEAAKNKKVDLSRLNRDQLVVIATEKGLTIANDQTRKQIIAAIKELKV